MTDLEDRILAYELVLPEPTFSLSENSNIQVINLIMIVHLNPRD